MRSAEGQEAIWDGTSFAAPLLAIPVLLVVQHPDFRRAYASSRATSASMVLGSADVTDEQCGRIEHKLGLDKPAVTQYFSWLGGVLQGDFGSSMTNRRSVTSRDRAPHVRDS